ncbi:MAG: M17 family peptidase N-terminal domain-containing protein [Myxococcota bacterium]
MRNAIEILLSPIPLERIDAEVAIAGFFMDERPLRGGVARADWRLCGGLSARIESGDLSGKSGEALLIGCGRALRAPRLLVLGLGDRHAFDQLRVTDETREAFGRCRKLGCQRVVFAPLGIASDDLPRHASALMSGIRAGWEGAERPLELRICVPRSELVGVSKAFTAAVQALAAEEVQILPLEAEGTRH